MHTLVLLSLLGSEDWSERERASEELAGNYPALLWATRSGDPEVRKRGRDGLPTPDLDDFRACWSLASDAPSDAEKDEVLAWAARRGLISPVEYDWAYTQWTRNGNMTNRCVDMAKVRLLAR